MTLHRKHVWLIYKLEQSNRKNIHQSRSFENTKAKTVGTESLQKVVNVTYSDTEQINENRVSQDKTKAKENPRQVGSVKVEQAKKVHHHVLILTTPDVDQHYGQRVAQKENVDKKSHQLRRRKSSDNNNVEQ